MLSVQQQRSNTQLTKPTKLCTKFTNFDQEDDQDVEVNSQTIDHPVENDDQDDDSYQNDKEEKDSDHVEDGGEINEDYENRKIWYFPLNLLTTSRSHGFENPCVKKYAMEFFLHFSPQGTLLIITNYHIVLLPQSKRSTQKRD